MRIALLNMPFAVVEAPSIGLTQLRARLRERFGDDVRVDIVYANQELAGQLGIEAYAELAELAQGGTGAGDWVFRQAAFPEAPDNTAGYLRRHFGGWDAQTGATRQALLAARDQVDDFLAGLVDRHDLAHCDIVGFTSMFAQNLSSFALARRLKRVAPGVTTVIGGANCEPPMGERIARSVPAIDYVFAGPALVSFPEFVAAALRGRAAQTSIPGVLSAAGLARGDVAGVGADLDIDHEVDLDYDDFLDQLGAWHPDPRPVLYFETSRGCWWGQRAHCTFCGLNGLSMGYRAMSPQRAVATIQRLFRYAGRCAELGSVDNILAKHYLREVLPALRPPAGVTLAYEVKANLSEADVRTLAAARVTKIQPGIEALATATLKLMRKGSNAFQNLDLLKSCVRHGVQPFWNLLVGFPGEDPAVYRKYLADIPTLVHLWPPSGVSPVRFDRYSPYFTRPGDFGLELEPYGCYRYLYPWDDEEIREVAYYFVDRGPGAYRQALMPWLPALNAEVDSWRSLWTAEGPAVELRVDWLPDEAVCRDTRFPPAREYRLTGLDAEVLWHLREPWRVRDLCAALRPQWSEAQVQAALRRLDERRLLFAEDGRYLSLAVDGTVSGWAPVVRRSLVTTGL
jgi:ribosomal peptide maturation radical SAM protein 1